MTKKLTGKVLVKYEAQRDIWREVLTGAKEIKTGGGTRIQVEPVPDALRQHPRSSERPSAT